jgi:hypothetical protein
MENLSDTQFLYEVYKVLLSINTYPSPFRDALLHYEFCPIRSGCQTPECVRLARLTSHVQGCATEFCQTCIPIRWLVTCHRLNMVQMSISNIPDWFHVDHFSYVIPPPLHPPPPSVEEKEDV